MRWCWERRRPRLQRKQLTRWAPLFGVAGEDACAPSTDLTFGLDGVTKVTFRVIEALELESPPQKSGPG